MKNLNENCGQPNVIQVTQLCYFLLDTETQDNYELCCQTDMFALANFCQFIRNSNGGGHGVIVVRLAKKWNF